MNRYLIRTNSEEKKTQIVRLGNPMERLGMIYTDFLIRPENRDITKEDIVNPSTNKPIGQVKLYGRENLIAVRVNGKDIASFNRDGRYFERGKIIPFVRYGKKDLSSEKYAKLMNMGIDHAYSLGKDSTLSHIFCFERNGGLASIVFGKKETVEIDDALKGLALSLAKRIENQDYVFEFLK